MPTTEELKRKRDQLNARIQQAEAREKQQAKKDETRVKVLVGAAILDSIKNGHTFKIERAGEILNFMDKFLTRDTDRKAILGEDGKGSKALRKLVLKPKTEAKPD